jgi:hypothetical protein
MDLIECLHCGSVELREQQGKLVCVYCRSTFSPTMVTNVPNDTIISLASDIDILLRKCAEDPRNSRKYASLILDIDPTNVAALRYL